MQFRSLLAGGITAVLTLAACTGGSGHRPSSSPGEPSSPAATTASSSTAPAPQERVTKFTPAWSWTSPTSRSSALFNETRAVAQDGTHAIVASDVGPSDLVATSRTYLTGLDLATGKQLWQHSFIGLPYYLQMVAGVAVVTEGTPLPGGKVRTSLVGVDPATGRQRWSYTGFSIPEPSPPAVLGSSLYVTVVSHLKGYAQRIDASTGKVIATRRVISGDPPAAGDGVVVWDNEGTLFTAYSADLRTELWKLTPDAPVAADDRVIGDVLVRTVNGSGDQASFYGYDVRSGRSLWSSRLTFDDRIRQFWPTSQTLVITTATSAVGLDVSDGRVPWHVHQSGLDHLAPSATAEDNLLGCGKSVASIDAADGGWYGGMSLSDRGFPDGCTAPPVATSTVAMVASGQTLAAYRITIDESPKPTPGDGYGDWGPVNPAVCGVDAAQAPAAFAAVLGGTWRLYAAGRNGNCGFTNGPKDVITRALTTAAARRYLDPANSDGGCTRAGADTGVEHAVAAPGLPAGSGACYVSGLTFGGTDIDDSVSGLTRQANGRWMALEYSVPRDTAASSGQPGKMLALLRRLSR